MPQYLHRALFVLVLLGILYFLMQLGPWISGIFRFLKAVFGPFFNCHDHFLFIKSGGQFVEPEVSAAQSGGVAHIQFVYPVLW